MVDGALIGTTEHDIFSIDPATCHQNWRISEDYTPATSQAVNRGAAYLDGRLFRGTEDGRDPPSKWWTPLISSYWSWKGV
jgi:alcohol dehydrogenase (cytochrome c)